jgi:hypothetical protein
MFEVEELDVVEYKFFLREAFIYNCSKTEDGLEYLRIAKLLEETDIDRKSLREYKGTN